MGNTVDSVEQVIDGLNALILSNLRGVAHEQYFPCADPDRMDEVIKQGKERASALRKLREQFEDTVTGIVGRMP